MLNKIKRINFIDILEMLNKSQLALPRKQMLPTDPRVHSGVPSENRSILYGSAMGLATVILGTKLMNTSPINSKLDY